MLYLGPDEIGKSISHEQLLSAVEEAFLLYEGEEFSMPDRLHAEYNGNVLLSMPSFNREGSGVKLVSVYPGNPARGVPMIQGLMILNDGETGKPLAIMDAARLTAMRTGAVGAVGVKYLAGESCRNLGLVGTGVQAWYLLLLSTIVRDFNEILVYDKLPDRAENFASRFRKTTGKSIRVAGSAEELQSGSEVVITATDSAVPVLPEKPELLEGRTIIGIGSYKPDMRELPSALFPLLKRVYIDSRAGIGESGDLSVPLQQGWINREQISTLGSLMADSGAGHPGRTRLFKSVGMGLFDLVVAQKIHRLAGKKNLGKKL